MTPSFRFAEGRFSRLRVDLLAHSPMEAGGILLCNEGASGRLLVEDIVVAQSPEMVVQRPDRLEFEGAFLARHVKRARDQNQSIILVHTHPRSEWPTFSLVDDAGEAALIPALFRRVPRRPHGAIVIGEKGFAGRLHDASGQISEAGAITEVGASILTEAIDYEAGEFGDLFDRSIRAFGVRGQQALSTLRVGIVGLGGTGSIVAQELAHLGVRSLTLVDDDLVEESNLNRVVASSLKDVSRPKVDVAADMVRRISTGKVDAIPVVANVLDDNGIAPLLDLDFVFCCTDSHGSRASLNQLAYQFLLPVIDVGVRIDASDGRVRSMSGRIQMLAPGLACLQCQRLLDPEEVRRDLLSDEERFRDPYIVGGTEPQPAVISLNGTVSSLGITMFLSAVAGVPAPARRLNYRIMEGIIKPAVSAPDPNCVVCSSSRGALAKGMSWPLLLRSR